MKVSDKNNLFFWLVQLRIDRGHYADGQKFESLGEEAEVINGELIWTRIDKPVKDNVNDYVKFNEVN